MSLQIFYQKHINKPRPDVFTNSWAVGPKYACNMYVRHSKLLSNSKAFYFSENSKEFRGLRIWRFL